MKQKMKSEIKHIFVVDVVWVVDVVACSMDRGGMDGVPVVDEGVVQVVDEDMVKLCGGMYVEVEEELKDLWIRQSGVKKIVTYKILIPLQIPMSFQDLTE